MFFFGGGFFVQMLKSEIGFMFGNMFVSVVVCIFVFLFACWMFVRLVFGRLLVLV